MLFVREEVGPNGFGQAVQWLAIFFYADDGLLASMRPTRLQAALGMLMGLFDRVGLRTKVNNMVGVVYQNC